MKFSQRYGYTPVKSVLQLEGMDSDLRNALWSLVTRLYLGEVQSNHEIIGPRYFLSNRGNEHLRALFQALWLHFFKQPLDTLPDLWEDAYRWLREHFFSCKWHEVYDLVEFIAQNHPDKSLNETFASLANTYLEREVSAYRFVDHRLVRITSPDEVEAVEASLRSHPGAVQQHLDQALKHLADRKSPDYRNSVKESISAVEALVREATGSTSGTLGDLLKKLGRRQPVHPALQRAFEILYGYTSDAKGIRHALLDEDRLTFDEAKFMLVTCSAFVNYITGVLKS